MKLNLAKKIPLLKNSRLLQKYNLYLESSGFKVDSIVWITASMMIAVTCAIALFILLPGFQVFSIILFIAITDIAIGIPYISAVKRIEQVESELPDILRQMSDVLKAGGTYEFALREIASSNFGPIKQEMEKVLRKLDEGENFENSFRTLSDDVDSKLVKRTVTIVIDSMRAGAGLAEILEQIADDVRELNRIERERKSRTLMQVLFLVAAGAMIAPMIFGFVSTIIELLITSAATAVGAQEIAKATEAMNSIQLSIQIYLLIEIIATSAMIALMREGKISKAIIYFPILLFIAFVLYYAGMVGSRLIVGNAA